MDIEKNRNESIELAKELYKVLTHPELVKRTTGEERHNLAVKKCNNFARAYPLVVAKMSRDGLYNEKAFERFLDKMYANPGKGMEGIITNQAEYAKLLYIEECKKRKKHWSIKIANEIFQSEYKAMRSWVKNTEKQEKEAKNEFAEEAEEHLIQKRMEFKNWLENMSKTRSEEVDQFRINLENLNFSEMYSSENSSENSLENPLEKPDVEIQETPQESTPISKPDYNEKRKQKQRENDRLDYLSDTNLSQFKRKRK